jgi:hypothetical protein
VQLPGGTSSVPPPISTTEVRWRGERADWARVIEKSVLKPEHGDPDTVDFSALESFRKRSGAIDSNRVRA